MSIVVKDNGQSYEQPPAGMHLAVCTNVYDLGLQIGFQGVAKPTVVILWELFERQSKGDYAGKRFLVSKRYTASLNEKANLRKDLDSWRGRPFTEEEIKGFDLERLIGVNCLINLAETKTKKGNNFMAVMSVNPPMKGQEKMTIETPRDYIPKWIEELLKTKVATEDSDGGPQPSIDDFQDDIPF